MRCIYLCLILLYNMATQAEGFVDVPQTGFANSAYTLCNNTGAFGLTASQAPSSDNENTCAIFSPALLASQNNPPLAGFNMVGMLVRDIAMPKPYAGEDEVVGTLTDTLWRNQEKTECIYGTHLSMKLPPLADGKTWEVNDISRGGFAGKKLAVAYFYKPQANQSQINTEMLFRVGRSFTSVRHAQGDSDLPAIDNPESINIAIAKQQAAAVNENWVTFTTDLNTQDPDGTSRSNSPMLYIKTQCSELQPIPMENAIRLRTTGQNGQAPFELTLPGLVPVDGKIDLN